MGEVHHRSLGHGRHGGWMGGRPWELTQGASRLCVLAAQEPNAECRGGGLRVRRGSAVVETCGWQRVKSCC